MASDKWQGPVSTPSGEGPHHRRVEAWAWMTTSNGLQPASDRLQPTSEGLQPESGGLQPTSGGLQPKSDRPQPKSNGTS